MHRRPIESDGFVAIASPPSRPAWRRYSVATVVVLLAWGAREVLTPAIGPTSLSFITFLPAVTWAAWYGGIGPAVLSVVLAGLTINWFYLPPIGSFHLDDPLAFLAFPVSALLIVLPVEMLRRARRSLARAHRLLATTLTSIGDGVAVTDRAGRVTFLNPEAQRLTGWTSEEAAGRLLTEVFRIVNEQTRRVVENPVDKVLREGNVVGLANHTVLIAKSGTETPIDDSAAPVRESGGPVEGVVLVFRDVREQRLTQLAQTRLAAIVESSGDAIISKDLDGKVLTWNAAAEQLFGYRADEIVGQSILALLPADHVAEETAILDALRAGRRSELVETTRLTKDGRRIPVSVRVSPLRDSDGQVIGASKVVRDLSDLVAARDALAQEKELLATTLLSIGDAVITTDQAARVSFLNAVAEDLTGWSRAEAVGQPLTTVFRIVSETTREEVENPALRAMRDGVIVGLANHTVLLSRSGEERAIDDSGAPIRDSQGRIVGSVLVFRDITERRRVEQELQSAEERSRSVIDHVLDGIITIDESGRVGSFNCAAQSLFGYAASEVVGRNVSMLMPEPYHSGHDQYLRSYMTTGVAKIIGTGREVVGRRKDGSTFPMELAVSQFHVGEQRCFTGIVRDLTERMRHEDALRQGQRRLAAILEQLPVAVAVMDQDGQWTVSNPAMRKFVPTTVPSRDAARANRWHALDEHGRPLLDEQWPGARALRGETVVPGVQFAYENDDGLLVHTIVSAIPLREESGEVSGAIAVVQDIDQLKRTELALRESEARFRVALDGTPITVFSCDRDLRFTWIYNSRPPMRDPAQYLGRRDADVAPAHAVRELVDLKSRVLATGKGERRVVAMQLGGVTSYYDAFVEPVSDADGHVVGLRGALSDISDRRRVEVEREHLRGQLAAKVEELQTILDIVPVQIWLADADCQAIHGNRRAYEDHGLQFGINASFGAPRPDLPAGLRIEAGGRVLQPSEMPMQIAARTGKPVHQFEHDVVHADGRRRTMLANVAPIVDAEGRVRSIVGAYVDVTELRAAEQALREADQRKNEFISTLAHELRNPLAPIKNSITLLQIKGPEEMELIRARNVIDRQVQQISRLLDDLLDVNRLDRGKLDLRKQLVTLEAIITGALETAKPAIEVRRHRVTSDIPNDIVLDADPVRLSQVFANLLNNAAKYMDAGGRIWVTATKADAHVIVSVKDAGIGISSDSLPQLFEMYAQVPLALERAQGGVGIGLSLAKGLVELHGGSISARSDGLGKGSEFLVRLPVAVGAPIPAEPVVMVIKRKPGISRRILIADDIRDNADTLATMLQALGHEVHVAYDGADALSSANRIRPEVALLDIGMPRLNGYDVCSMIRQQDWGKSTYIIAQTGWGQEEDRRRAEQAGFDRHMLKPVDCAALVVVLSNLPARL